MGRRAFASLLGLSIALSAGLSHAAGPVPEPDGYRMENYRSPVPETLKGAKVVTTEEVIALWKNRKAVFIDVLPHDPKPENLPAGTIWKEKTREDIPDSAWLVNVGYGVLNKETETYFREGLRKLVGDDMHRAMVFYCMRDCWMSWNAAKRAVEMGYSGVLWYPLGTDGWAAAGQPTEKNVPFEF